MSVDSLLTLVGLVFAVYAVLPRHRRLELRMRVQWSDILVAGCGFVLASYFVLFEDLPAGCIIPGLELGRLGLSPSVAAFLTCIATLGILWWKLAGPGLSGKNGPRFRDLVEDLAQSGNYSDLHSLLEENLDRLMPLCDRRGKPKMDEGTLTVVQSLNRLLGDPLFANETARRRPYFGLKLAGHDTTMQEPFFENWMRWLVSNPGSVLYAELRDNENLAQGDRYEVPSRNRILHYLFHDVKIAYQHHVWNPLALAALEDLDRFRLTPAQDPYNRVLGDFHEDGRWSSPLFATVRIFDIMVMEALYQGHEWHMFLFYLQDIVERICNNYYPEADREYSPDTEWPLRYDYITSEVFSVLRGWIKETTEVPAGQANVKLQRETLDHENGNIPKSAILALGQCVHHVARAARMAPRTKAYFLRRAISTFFDLRARPETVPYARVLVLSLLQGGLLSRDDGIEVTRLALVDAFSGFDTIPHSHEHVAEFKRAIGYTGPAPSRSRR